MKDLKNLSKKFKALGNERRLKIIRELLKYKRLTVGDISNRIKLSFRSTSKHLKVLESAGFVSWKQVGTNMHYFILVETPKEFLDLIRKLS